MRINRIINNNVISTTDDNGVELVIMGKGLGFGKKPGQLIDYTKIEKIFRMDSEKEMEDFKELVKRLPIEYFRITNQIISYTKDIIGLDLNQNIYLTLTDHISFAVERYQKGMHFPNTLYEEIRMFYPKEFLVGKKALELIEEVIKVKLPEDEAASIALHLVNAEYQGSVGNALQMTTMISEIVKLIDEEYPDIQILSDGSEEAEIVNSVMYKNWMISNIKYLVHRLLKLPPKNIDISGYRDAVLGYCIREYSLVLKIDKYLYDKYHVEMTEEEKIFLTIVINRETSMIN